ncbi:uncharacterized protein G2W53_017887 [Senna tora]|uniref:Uncharacterized protein n=1 Tax=Senna tora TaxID=362788 RepID=A0A834TQB9_9FABA|nr:uncharacterized protein G2W53_017887 [Senna tora]
MDWGYEDVIFETDAQIVKIDAQWWNPANRKGQRCDDDINGGNDNIPSVHYQLQREHRENGSNV